MQTKKNFSLNSKNLRQVKLSEKNKNLISILMLYYIEKQFNLYGFSGCFTIFFYFKIFISLK